LSWHCSDTRWAGCTCLHCGAGSQRPHSAFTWASVYASCLVSRHQEQRSTQKYACSVQRSMRPAPARGAGLHQTFAACWALSMLVSQSRVHHLAASRFSQSCFLYVQRSTRYSQRLLRSPRRRQQRGPACWAPRAPAASLSRSTGGACLH